MNKKKITNFGQSLFEVVFAVAIAAMILVGIVSLATTSTRNSIFSRNNSQATKYAQEVVEWLREERDKDWINLSSHIGNRCLGIQRMHKSPSAEGCAIIMCVCFVFMLTFLLWLMEKIEDRVYTLLFFLLFPKVLTSHLEIF